ncbi:penicillin-binding protein 1C [Plebeiibacterium marinum]|uniref:peptidoglycan glycosyltransferase n=1 Tax=Plebeiibacterium marinum TaxID=2992111 RepID=A0AAE3SKU1_9BACT|nr:penicillin-binding protein 1C [Plebeiobacterium marinum]MCW3806754.1 penicillin-binding protein 1C [Plebeiobacterium marinum]
MIIGSRKRLVFISIPLLLFIGFWFSLSFPLFKVPYSTVIYSSEHKLLGAHIACDGQWRFPQCDSVPHKFKECITMFEDEHFYRHPGVNLVSLGRALYQNISKGKIVSGGSTLSMQVIRLSKQRERNVVSKVIELIQALRLELVMSKESILKKYATHAPFGGNVVGIDAASWRYFQRPAYQLSWAEQAMLAVLPNAPGLIHTNKNRGMLKEKRDLLLRKLYNKGKIDSVTLMLAVDEPVPDHPYALPQLAPHLLDYCRKKKEGEIYTLSLKSELQQQVNSTLQFHHEKLKLNEVHNACAIVIDVKTGKVLSYCGNVMGESNQNHVDIVMAPRSTGSILKPFLYAGCLQDGQILPRMLVKDVPTYYKNFAPKNYSRMYSGAVPADEALSRSLNVPAVNMLEDYGIGRFCNLLQKTGLGTIKSDPDYYGLSLILGGGEATLFELAGAYASMARTLNEYCTNNGLYRTKEFFSPIVFNNDTISKGVISSFYPVYSAGSVYYTFNAMTNVARPPEESGWQTFSSSRKIAWKTGTSFGYRDAWAVGVTPEYVVGVWVGNATGEGRPGIVGGTAAGPILFDIFHLLPATTWFQVPYDDMEKVAVCKKSGCFSGPYCEVDSVFVPVAPVKIQRCPYHKLIHLNKEKTHQVSSDCYPVSTMVHEGWFVLPPVMEWYYKKNHPLYKTLPPFMDGCGLGNNKMMQFIYPQNNNKVYIPVGLNGALQSVVLKVAHRNAGSTIYWHLDDEYLGATSFVHHMCIQPDPGSHLLSLIDDKGNTLYKKIVCVGRGDNK